MTTKFSINEADEALARRALEKKKQGKSPNRAELAALLRFQESQVVEMIRACRPKFISEICNITAKQMNEWESIYGIPFGKGRNSIDLVEVIRKLRQVIADNARMISGKGVGGGTEFQEMKTTELEAKNRKVIQQNEMLELQLKEKRKELKDVTEVRALFGTIVAMFSAATKRLEQRFGPEAIEVIEDCRDEAVELFNKSIDQKTGQG